MTDYHPEPVEVSARFRASEWTEESLEQHAAQYRDKLAGMGAAASDIEIDIRHHPDGTADVIGIWRRPV